MTGSANAPPIEVVAAIIFRPDGEFLLARRPPGKVYAGWWEFPGGKVEPGEAPAEALRRELHEELGIDVTCAWPWITREYVYPHGHVRLRFFRLVEWTGVPHAREGQALSWQRSRSIDVAPLLPANGPILRALTLPPMLGITNAGQIGAAPQLSQLDRALQRGLRMVMVREKDMTLTERRAFASEVVRRCHDAGVLALINGDADLAHDVAADGVHLNAAQLLQSSRRPAGDWCGASCHTERELAHAASLELDYVVLGAVLATPTHPDTEPLGWPQFERMIETCPLPVFAVGGMQPEHFAAACSAGAHGVAMIRGAWAPGNEAYQSFSSGWSSSGSGSASGMR